MAFYQITLRDSRNIAHPATNEIVEVCDDEGPKEAEQQFWNSQDPRDREALKKWIAEGYKLKVEERFFDANGVMRVAT